MTTETKLPRIAKETTWRFEGREKERYRSLGLKVKVYYILIWNNPYKTQTLESVLSSQTTPPGILCCLLEYIWFAVYLELAMYAL